MLPHFPRRLFPFPAPHRGRRPAVSYYDICHLLMFVVCVLLHALDLHDPRPRRAPKPAGHRPGTP